MSGGPIVNSPRIAANRIADSSEAGRAYMTRETPGMDTPNPDGAGDVVWNIPGNVDGTPAFTIWQSGGGVGYGKNDQGTQANRVTSIGFNCQGGNRVDLTQPGMGIGFEPRYFPTGAPIPYSEGHFYFADTVGRQHRVFSVTAVQDGSDLDFYFQASRVYKKTPLAGAVAPFTGGTVWEYTVPGSFKTGRNINSEGTDKGWNLTTGTGVDATSQVIGPHGTVLTQFNDETTNPDRTITQGLGWTLYGDPVTPANAFISTDFIVYAPKVRTPEVGPYPVAPGTKGKFTWNGVSGVEIDYDEGNSRVYAKLAALFGLPSDLAGGATLADAITCVNTILAQLRTMKL